MLSLEEVNERFPDEWIVLKVARFNENHRITYGYVLSHSRSRRVATRVTLDAYRADRSVQLYIFYGGDCILTREEWQRRLNELPDEPYLNAHPAA